MGFDKKISYWIFVWFLIYYFNFTSYNPFLLLVLGFIFNLYNMFCMYFKKMYDKLFVYAIVNICIKFIPILLLIYDNRAYIDVKSFNFTVIFVIVYLLYMRLTNTSLKKAYYNNENNNTPLTNFLEKYMQKFK
tara:strand:+ start:168 stop:566 length:399 start_codon:yes stop_codon:yes gene_type:complete